VTSKITIFDHNCKPLAILDNVPTTPRSWVLNGYGKAQFAIDTSSDKCTEQLLQFGNLVHITHAPDRTYTGGRLPTWTGIILPNRDWEENAVNVTALSAEAILSFRAMPYKTLNTTPGEAFKTILAMAQKIYTNIVFSANVVDNSITYNDDLKLNAYDHINKIIEASLMDWDVIGTINANGNLELTANLYQAKGSRVDFTLTETNTEMGSPRLTEQGTPSNVVHGFSQDVTPNSRRGAIGINQSAFDDYGPLELNKVFMGVHDEASVRQSAQSWADKNGRPSKRIGRNVLNQGTAFSYLNVGNILGIRERAGVGFLPGGGFGIDGYVQVITMSYNDTTDKVNLVVDINPEILKTKRPGF